MDKQKLVLVVFMVFVLVAVLSGAFLGQKQAALLKVNRAAFPGEGSGSMQGTIGASGARYLQDAITQYGKFLISGQITEIGTDSITVVGYSGGEALARRGANGGSVTERAVARAGKLAGQAGAGSDGAAAQNKPATHTYTVMVNAETVIDTDQNIKNDLKGAIRQAKKAGTLDPSKITLPTTGSLKITDLKVGMRVKVYAAAEVPASDATVTASMVSVGNGDPMSAFSSMPNFPADAFGNFPTPSGGFPPIPSITIDPGFGIDPQN